MIRRTLIAIYYCRPQRSYAVFRFLVTVFLLFRRRQRWLLWTPLAPEALVANIRALGASFLKLAQVLATRADFFDQTYLQALRQLHDKMPAMREKHRRRAYKRAFPDSRIFSKFDDEPVASASIGQVHKATLQDSGETVAVKLLRENIQFQVRVDIFLLNFFLRLFRPLFTDQTRHSIESVLRAFSQVILQEVSMLQELANMEHFSQVYADSGVRFPQPYPEYCSDTALVMSFEQGARFDDVAAVAKLNVSFEELMKQLVLFYTEQMLIKGYFHADPHPGNLLVSPQGELILLDFGMVSRIPQQMRQAMIYAVKAAYERDFEMLVNATRKMGILTEESDFSALSSVAESLFEVFDSDHLDASSMQELAFGILEVLNDQPFKLPQDIIYVMRVSSLVEGLGTQYIENFNGIKDILPILKESLPRALGEDRLPLEKMKHELLQLPMTATKARRVVELAEQGELVVRMATADRQFLLGRLERYLATLGWLIFYLALGFYFQRFQQQWLQYASYSCLLLALLVLLKRKEKG
ncbi:Predicted unusual protein kinase regulating ubiquinone biosynthesis, AarF/ABC1/UbiB family [Malonomonas rubra DSM 5091]|uniref:Predicted unusual protein kinase regulating ubiquinone biosynthesis, AarF/ABC1/UbiB family n=1 Tax=Malonomonas rubra DSM 5091 TaxID=1122189 RepID=A0A1M6G3D8_MALRU|nr:AarF/UbiB family protein [Malonomonas rubra]SHJ04469.1 Predicted unusual protein kinase regulating ubiquinone biosynthesis, AarF/ABC1/UbiB family [Malonomonas rubra DSM 5091]